MLSPELTMTLLEKLVPRSRRVRSTCTCAGCGAPIGLSAETFHVDSYRIHRCGACGSLAPDPLPTSEQLRVHYAGFNDNYSGGMGAARFQREMPKRFDARLDVIERLGGQGRLLDLGGGNGMFGRLAHARGFRVDIADFVPAPTDLGFARVVPADLSARGGVPLGDGSFDVVTSWSCLEHVRDPGVALAEMWRLLRPGGLLAVDTPLVGDLCERLFAARSTWICPPEHLFIFSARGLMLAAERAGFEILKSSPFFERTAARAFARRGRNLAVAAKGLLIRTAAPARWERDRDALCTPAADIQLLIARKP
jgi:SAM-dependent methyltransferase